MSIHRFGFLFIAAIVFSCSSPEHPAESGSEPTDSSSFDALHARYADVLRDLPAHPDSTRVIQELVQAAARAPWFNGGDVSDAIISKYPNDPLSLHLLGRRHREIFDDPNSDGSKTYLRSVQEAAPDSSVASKALYLELELLRAEDINAFLDTCSTQIESADSDRSRRVALLQRMNYYAESGHAREAAMDALLFWSEFADTVERMKLRPKLKARLERAGWILEAWALVDSKDTFALGKAIRRDFQAADGQTADKFTLTKAYLNHTPDTEAIEGAIVDTAERALGDPIYWARLASIAAAGLNVPTLTRYLGEYKNSLTAFDGKSTESMDFILATGHALRHQLSEVFGNSRWTDRFLSGRDELDSVLLEHMGGASWAALQLETRESKRHATLNAASYSDVVDAHVEFLRTISHLDGIVPAYESIGKRYPETEESGRALLKIAEHYQDTNRHAEAAEAYASFVATQPESNTRATAVLKLTIALMSDEKYEAAEQRLQDFLKAYPKDARLTPPALYLRAICQDALGLANDAIATMKSVAQDYPTSGDSPRALYWLGSHHISIQELDAAATYLSELTLRYPDDKLTTQARRLLNRIEDAR